MNIEEFKTSLGADLAVDDVVQHLRDQGYTVEAIPQEDSTDDDQPDVYKAIQEGITAALSPLQQEIKSLQDQVIKLGNEPGAKPTDVAAAADAPSGVNGTQTVDALQVLAQAANNKERVDTLS